MSETNTQPVTAPAVASSELLAALGEYDDAHPAFCRIPYLVVFRDGSGRLMHGDTEMLEFGTVEEAVRLLRAANK